MYAGARACMRACTYTRADTLGASAFTWSACCTSRPRRAPLIYGDRINYKERIEKSVNRLWRTVSAIILLCSSPLPSRTIDYLLAEGRRGRNFRPSNRISIFVKSYFSRALVSSLPSFFFWDASRLLSRVMQLKLAFYARGLRLKRRPKRRSLR